MTLPTGISIVIRYPANFEMPFNFILSMLTNVLLLSSYALPQTVSLTQFGLPLKILALVTAYATCLKIDFMLNTAHLLDNASIVSIDGNVLIIELYLFLIYLKLPIITLGGWFFWLAPSFMLKKIKVYLRAHEDSRFFRIDTPFQHLIKHGIKLLIFSLSLFQFHQAAIDDVAGLDTHT